MSAIKFHAAQALAAALAAQPALAGDVVKVGQQPPDRAAEYPALVILPERFTFTSWPHLEVEDADGDVVVADGKQLVEVGSVTGSVRLWAGANYPPQREALEEAVLAAFSQLDDAPGLLEVTLVDVKVGGVATGVNWAVAFTLEGDEWRDELAFSERRWSFIQVEVDLPVIVLRSGTPIITELIAALSRDTATEVEAPADLATLADLEEVLINEDGSLSAAP